MAAFELNFSQPSNQCSTGINTDSFSRRDSRAENLIALKIYDVCRGQNCLDYSEIGPARAAQTGVQAGRQVNEGDIIVPPNDATSVTIDNARISKINIVSKVPNCFRKGYWDVELKYVIEYRLIFTDANGNIIQAVMGASTFTKKISLFGSEGSDLFVSTDLLGANGMFEAAPFILAEGKAVALSASFIYDCMRCNPCSSCGCESPSQSAGQRPDTSGAPLAVEVTLGLFSIIKLFRLVDMAVESRGFTIPGECEEISPMNPCDYFDSLDFPMDLFAPPVKADYLAGVSNNIPASKKGTDSCCDDSCCR